MFAATVLRTLPLATAAQSNATLPQATRTDSGSFDLVLPAAEKSPVRVSLHDLTANGVPLAAEELQVTEAAQGVWVLRASRQGAVVWRMRLHDTTAGFQLRDESEAPLESAAPVPHLTDTELLRQARRPDLPRKASRLLPVYVGRSGALLAVSRGADGNARVRYEAATGEIEFQLTGPRLQLALLADVPLQQALLWLKGNMTDLPLPVAWSLLPLAERETAQAQDRLVFPPDLNAKLSWYRSRAAQRWEESGVPVLRPVSFDVPEQQTGQYAEEFFFGDDLLVAPSQRQRGPKQVGLPEGLWVNYWTGLQSWGGQSIPVEATASQPAIWVRSGSVLPERGPSADSEAYVVFPGVAENQSTHTADADGHTIRHEPGLLEIAGGAPRQVEVRWRFLQVHAAWLNGEVLTVKRDANGSYVDFAYAERCSVSWR